MDNPTSAFMGPGSSPYTTAGGTWNWNNTTGGAQFTPTPPAKTGALPGTVTAPTTPSSAGTSTVNSVFSSNLPTGGLINTGGAGYGGLGYIGSRIMQRYGGGSPLQTTAAAPPNISPAPAAPDYSNLQNLQAQVERKSALQKAMQDYNNLYASTQAQGQQGANTAAAAYASAQQAAGVNPSAAGVVRAQSMLPVFSQLGQIRTQQDTTRLQATNQADTLAAQIASTIGNLQSGYSKTLADYNMGLTQTNAQMNEFNAGQANQMAQFGADYNLRYQQWLAQLKAMQAPQPLPINRGYITNSGPIMGGTGSTPGNPVVLTKGLGDIPTISPQTAGGTYNYNSYGAPTMYSPTGQLPGAGLGAGYSSGYPVTPYGFGANNAYGPNGMGVGGGTGYGAGYGAGGNTSSSAGSGGFSFGASAF